MSEEKEYELCEMILDQPFYWESNKKLSKNNWTLMSNKAYNS